MMMLTKLLMNIIMYNMKITKNATVRLKTFHGKTFSKELENTIDDFWKLIGLNGMVADEENENVLVLFEENLDNFNVANHNRIKNSLWISKLDLEITE